MNHYILSLALVSTMVACTSVKDQNAPEEPAPDISPMNLEAEEKANKDDAGRPETAASPAPMVMQERMGGAAAAPGLMGLGSMGSGGKRSLSNHTGFMADAVDGDDSRFNTEAYERVAENLFKNPVDDPLSTFSIDVDTAAYSNVRRFLNQNTLPPKDAVRIEELLNYFSYGYEGPKGDAPFGVDLEIADAPWAPKHRLLRIGLKGKEIPFDKRPQSNLVFLLDVSGSMNAPNKLPLLKRAMSLLVDNLGENDRIGIVVYAGASGVVLQPTSAANKATILEALERLEAGGSTNAGDGIEVAYKMAIENFIPGGVNRVILCTDGDFNVGTTSRGALDRLIEEKAKSKVFLTVLGFGMGNYKDSNLELLADKGNGNYGYIDDIKEARKVLVEEIGGTLITIAKDVKIQVEFNPAKVAAYRLIGYENRMLAARDFNDDKKDAGEIGAGHTVTALYEIVPVGVEPPSGTGSVDALKYQTPAGAARGSEEMLTLKLRYKQPEGDTSQLLSFPVKDSGGDFDSASTDYKFAAGVAAFGMVLRDSEHKGLANLKGAVRLARAGLANDPGGYRSEFIALAEKALTLQK